MLFLGSFFSFLGAAPIWALGGEPLISKKDREIAAGRRAPVDNRPHGFWQTIYFLFHLVWIWSIVGLLVYGWVTL